MIPVTTEDVSLLLAEHRRYFHEGHTLALSFRLEQLQRLKEALLRYEAPILDALRQDLGKGEFEGYATEFGFVLSSIAHTRKHLKRWMKPQRVRTPLQLQPASSRIISEPYGTILIISPFNYPFQLLMEPLIGAIAAGNCAVLKPSEAAPHVTEVISRLIGETFPKEYIRVVEGEKETVSALIHSPFDYIFFTGSVPVGRIVMEAAAKNLVPVTLELGGKSPVIVDATANLELAAKRIIWGKLLNAGQTCIAPDYVLAHSSVKAQLIDNMKNAIRSFYGEDAQLSPDYGRIIHTRHVDRLASILDRDQAKIVYGGRVAREERYMEPTLLDQVTWDDASMEDEIFGPILPILEYSSLDEAIRVVREHPKPLALYLFTQDSAVEQEVLHKVSFGGGCVNDTISHVASANLPFGGVGNAGIGAYHGKHSFEVFSHRKSVMKKSTRFETGLLFPPYRDKIKWVRKVLK